MQMEIVIVTNNRITKSSKTSNAKHQRAKKRVIQNFLPTDLIDERAEKIWDGINWIPITDFCALVLEKIWFKDEDSKFKKNLMLHVINSIFSKYDQFSHTQLLISINLIHKARINGLIPNRLEYIPIFCTSLILSSKFYDDIYIQNKEYSKIFEALHFDPNYKIQEMLNDCLTSVELENKYLQLLNENERTLLRFLDYNVFVTKEQLDSWIYSFSGKL